MLTVIDPPDIPQRCWLKAVSLVPGKLWIYIIYTSIASEVRSHKYISLHLYEIKDAKQEFRIAGPLGEVSKEHKQMECILYYFLNFMYCGCCNAGGENRYFETQLPGDDWKAEKQDEQPVRVWATFSVLCFEVGLPLAGIQDQLMCVTSAAGELDYQTYSTGGIGGL